jgi:5'-deoxynucleotidase YfbR-like HD superfamily hydrolase
MTPRRSTARTPRAWQRMLSGRRLDLLDPSPLDVEIADIAHGLARVARWNGQTRGAHIFSVAQHSLLVEAVSRRQNPNIDRRWRLAALMHAISLRFGMPATWPAALNKIVKQADFGAAYLEATRLAGFSEPEARRFFGEPPGLDAATEKRYLIPWGAEIAEKRFLKRFGELAGDPKHAKHLSEGKT